MEITFDHLIGALAVLIFILIRQSVLTSLNKLHAPETEDNERWKVGDFKRMFADLPDDMPVILLDSTTDNTDDMNYHFTNQEIDVDDYYNNGSEEALEGIPAGKALFLYFDNKLNENPIN
jgi:hypothetical protein